MVRTIDWFNEHLKQEAGNHLLEDRNLEVYQLYMAKKNGKPNDDFPSNIRIFLSQNLQALKIHRQWPRLITIDSHSAVIKEQQSSILKNLFKATWHISQVILISTSQFYSVTSKTICIWPQPNHPPSEIQLKKIKPAKLAVTSFENGNFLIPIAGVNI